MSAVKASLGVNVSVITHPSAVVLHRVSSREGGGAGLLFVTLRQRVSQVTPGP